MNTQESLGASIKQAPAIIDGLEADVATLALAADVDVLHENGDLVAADWQQRLPDHSAPYTMNWLDRSAAGQTLRRGRLCVE